MATFLAMVIALAITITTLIYTDDEFVRLPIWPKKDAKKNTKLTIPIPTWLLLSATWVITFYIIFTNII